MISRVPAPRVSLRTGSLSLRSMIKVLPILDVGRGSRDIHAKLIDQLASAKAKTIVHTAFFFEPQVDPGLVFIRKMKSALSLGQEVNPTSEEIGKLIMEAEEALDTDALLAVSVKKAGNVLLPSVYVLGDQQGRPGHSVACIRAGERSG
jgi:hypothetical protein